MSHLFRVQRINQVPVFAVGHDIPWSAIICGYKGKAACSRLNQGKAKGFGQGGINKNSSGLCSQAVQFRNIVSLMSLGIGCQTIKIIFINIQEDASQDFF